MFQWLKCEEINIQEAACLVYKSGNYSPNILDPELRRKIPEVITL